MVWVPPSILVWKPVVAYFFWNKNGKPMKGMWAVSSDYLKQIEHLTSVVIWKICDQTTSQNQAKHVPCDLHSTQFRLAWGHQGDSLSGKGSSTLEDNGCVVFVRKGPIFALESISSRTEEFKKFHHHSVISCWFHFRFFEYFLLWWFPVLNQARLNPFLHLIHSSLFPPIEKINVAFYLFTGYTGSSEV